MTKEEATRQQELEQSLRRACGYELLARCFAYPDESAVDGMCELAALSGHLLAHGPLHELLETLALATPEELEGGYVECFTLTTSADVPTFETAYVCTDPGQQPARMADINGFYRAFGVDAADSNFRPDDISVELEFMSFLCRKQAYAIENLGRPRVRQAARAQRMFLAEHLGRWGGALGGRAELIAQSSRFYRALGRGLKDWVELDAQAIGAEMTDRVVSPQLPWPDRAERGGIFAPPATVVGLDEIAVSR